MNKNKKYDKLFLDDNFIEKTIKEMPLATFDDVLNQSRIHLDYLNYLMIDSFNKIDSKKWNALQIILYELNKYMFINSLDPQMHGNLNRFISRAIIYHAQCEFQETSYLNNKFSTKKSLEKAITNYVKENLIGDFIDRFISIKRKNKKKSQDYYIQLSLFFIYKSMNFSYFYSNNLFFSKRNKEIHNSIFEIDFKKLFLQPNPPGKILYFFNEIVRITMFSRLYFAIGANLFLERCLELHIKILSGKTLESKSDNLHIFHSPYIIDELPGGPIDQINSSRIFNGLKQILDCYHFFLQGFLEKSTDT